MIFIDFNGEIPNQPPGTQKKHGHIIFKNILYIRFLCSVEKFINKCFFAKIRGIGKMCINQFC